ncbi:Putative beta-barrel porin-2, OmpL-like. bbp2 [Pedobacter westerhofensis]|uniref:Beta-barrel porin-2, OmpL-like. bbp2 n=1 Tax=Pedobacter westerhofensis TaxID=425512 RepID=A0A521B9P4_9SPHI|nr:porin [Pedobacter westerhofensis]SMO43809.1 Putative beta-barrel porin-2, OmpL-like. bbp2 [Pedobacter westerhofensis]
MKKLLILGLGLAIGSCAYAQDAPKIKVTGYLEAYYGYDFNKPADNNRPGFVYSHNRHNEVNLNLGFIKGSYESDIIRANIAVMAGTYANANLAAEPGVLKNIFEANAGVKLSKTANLWVDAGIFASHIGFESAISKDCWVLTRNIASDNTPYYESGAKITYITEDGKFTATALYLNGWQRINRQDGNSQPAGGLQLTWKPTGKITVNYSNYLGTEGADSIRVRRFYHNIYGIFQLTDHFGLTAGFDYGTQQKAKGTDGKNEVLSPVAIAQYKFNSKWALAGRVEYYKDKNGVIIATETPNGFQTTGYSMNIDYAPVSNAVVRLEGKVYDSKDKVFTRDMNPVKNSATLTASIAVSF